MPIFRHDKPEKEILLDIYEFLNFAFIKISQEIHFLNLKIDKLMTNEEFVQAITDLKTEVEGIGTKVDALEAAINNAGDTVPQTVVDAFTALKTSTDALNVKADNTPTTPPTV